MWTLPAASKLIESVLIGLPIPQIFWYEKARNDFLVIDGQQRLMSLYYFREGRFPRLEIRPQLRRIYDTESGIPEEIFRDDRYFQPFKLRLAAGADGRANRFSGLSYQSFSNEQRSAFDLRAIRVVIIKQIRPVEDDSSSVYEIFNRLNTAGMNLRPQEIRSSLYHSDFLDMLGRVNEIPGWRRLFGSAEPDLHMQDVQFLLRAFAVLEGSASYAPSMIRFLDRYSEKARHFEPGHVTYLQRLFAGFIAACEGLAGDAMGVRGRNLSITVLEAVFSAACRDVYPELRIPATQIDPAEVAALKADDEFIRSFASSTSTASLQSRLEVARRLISPLRPA